MDTIEEKVRGACRRLDWRLLAAVSLAALAGMLAAHGFAFANLFPNHDSTVLVFDAQWTMYVLGRWAQNLYFPLIRGKIAAPWLIGGFSIVYMALSGACIASLLRLRRAAAVLLTALLAVCASVTSALATYTYETDAYLLAMLLACVGVLWLKRPAPWRESWEQRCFSVAAWHCTRPISNLPWAVSAGAAAPGPGGGSLAGLAAPRCADAGQPGRGSGPVPDLGKISLALTGYQLADTGNGLAQLTRLGPAAILAGIPATYKNFFTTLLGYSGWNDRGMRAASAVLLLLTLWGLFLRLRGKTLRAVVQSLIAVALLPLGLNVVYLLASGNVYILMQHAVFLIYALPLLLFSGMELPRPPRAFWRWCTAVLCAFLLVRMVICSNGAYVYTKLVYDQTARQMTTIMAQVQQLPGYEEGVTPVAFVGDFTDSLFAYSDPAFSRYAEGDLHQVSSAVTYDGTIKWWFQHVMGSRANVVADQGQLNAWAEDARVEAMPVYPYDGYCTMIDGTAVIRIS